ncbi:MAG TPA: aminoglycoside phosphotransferase family protein [Streptosporangiaceae bacterium]|nr:aminoglycoside phosphotransferase family protein [Streptosporangiaceae bacterium]
MSIGDGSPNHPPADLPDLLRQACRLAGYPPGARLIRHFANAVYLLEQAPVVARVGYGTGVAAKASTAIAVTRWLIEHGFPATAPAQLPSGAGQPVVLGPISRPVSITFWRHYPQPPGGAWPDTAALASIAKSLHSLPPPPIDLPHYQPLRSLDAAVSDPAALLALSEDQRSWLTSRIDELRQRFAELDFPLGHGLIHADLYTGNLLWNTSDACSPVVLGDWDSVCVGPRVIDLIPTYAEARFGVDQATVDVFAHAYGHELRAWDGYEVLYDLRELSTLTALIRLAPSNARLGNELAHRLALLMKGDRATPWHGQ